MSVDALREAASKAYTENRLYAPAEDNAVEYYLALRDKLPGDAAVSSALVDLLPMTVIAIEQSVNREDFAEAQRLAEQLGLCLIGRAKGRHYLVYSGFERFDAGSAPPVPDCDKEMRSTPRQGC